jgi:hypothetical protein
MERLLSTNMITPMINVVAASQEHWSKTIDVGMPESDGMQAAIATGKVPSGKVERVKHERELYTVGVRNVLITDKLPSLERYALAAVKYEAIVVPSHELQLSWSANQARLLHGVASANPAPHHLLGEIPACVPVPITNLPTLRTAIFGN